MPFEGGCTLVADLRRLRIRYCIRKKVTSTAREERQQAYASSREGGSRVYFGGADPLSDPEPFAAMHRGG